MADMASDRDSSIDTAATAITHLLNGTKPEKTPEPAPVVEEPTDAPAEAAPADAEQPDHIPDEASLEGAAPSEEAPQGDQTPPAVMQAPSAPQVAPQVVQPAPNNPPAASPHQALAQLNVLVPQLQAQLAVSFPDIKTIEDLERLSREDPARVIAYQVLERRVLSAMDAQAKAQHAARTEWLEGEKAALARLVPDLSDPKKGPALSAQLTSYAKSLGYTDEQIGNATATAVATLHKAMLHDEGVKAAEAKAKADAAAIVEAKKKAADAPPVQKPGAQRTNDKADKFKETRDRLRKTGNVDDAAKVFSLLG